MKGPQQPRGLGRSGAPAARAAVAREGEGIRRSRRLPRAVGAAPLCSCCRRRRSDPAAVVPGAGAAAGVEGRRDPGAACGGRAPRAPGGRPRWEQTKPGADAPQLLGRPRGWALGRKEKAPGRWSGRWKRLGRPPKGRPGSLLAGGMGGVPRTGWGAALSEEPTRGSQAAVG